MAFFHELPNEKKRRKMDKRNASWEEGGRYRTEGRDSGNKGHKGARDTDGSSGLPRQRSSRPDFESSGKKGTGREIKTEKRSWEYSHSGAEKKAPAPKSGRSTGAFYTKEKKRETAYTGTELSEKGNDRFRDYEYRKTEAAQGTAPETYDEFILTGRNPIREALKSGRDLEKLLVQKGELSGSAREIVAMAKENRIMVQIVDKTRLDEISQHHQGLIAVASAYQYATMEELYETAKEKKEAPFFILLDGITDPHNLGAIIRTAECAGAHGVIVPQHRSVGLTPAAVKASAGAVEHVKVARVTNLNRTIEDLQKNGVWVYGLSMDGEDYEKIAFDGGVALVIGAEGDGISRLTSDKCDQIISLPMCGQIDSLNASVAAGIMMYRVLSCRRNKH